MKCIIVQQNDFDKYVAKIFARQLLIKPDSTFCFATGTTTEKIFEELVKLKQELDLDFTNAKAVNLDEYCGVSKEDIAGCYYRICRDLYIPLGLKEENFYVPIAPFEEREEECERFKQVLDSFGGIDLMLLSVGTNGHIAFNEPTTPWGLDVFVTELSKSTLEAKSELFGGIENVPKYGITMGVARIMQARQIVFVAKGSHKADIIHKIFRGPVTESIPGSVLQLHPNVLMVVDENVM